MEALSIAVLPKAENILIHTGNIINWNQLKTSAAHSATDEYLGPPYVSNNITRAVELNECLKSTVTAWSDNADCDGLQYASDVCITNAKFVEKLNASERLELKLTVKIFTASCDRESIIDAINKVKSELDVTFIETIILSVPEEHRSLSHLEPLWLALEEMVNSHVVYSIGISDLSTTQLEELYSWANVKPCINQVNLTTCCVIPSEMSEFAKEHDIQLLTHNDPPVILSTDDFQKLMAGMFKCSTDSMLWYPQWVARYTVLIKCRGVIKSKGFMLRALRDIKKLPYAPSGQSKVI